MSHTYSGNPANNPGFITIPDDGDDEVVASVNPPFQDLADNVAHIGEPTFTNTVGYPLLLRTTDRVQAAMPWQDNGSGGTDWTNITGAGSGAWTQLTTATNPLVQPLDAPDQALLPELRVYVQGAPLDGGLPASMPTIRLYEIDVTAGTKSILATQADTSANLASYQAVHPITMSLSGVAITKTLNRYVVELTGESGAGSNAGMLYWGTVTRLTVERTDPLAG